MFSFYKKRTYDDFSFLKRDIHAHLLPGVDDGAKTVEESLQLMQGLGELGFEHLTATPHVMADYYPNTRANLEVGYGELMAAAEKSGGLPRLHPGAEYMLDPGFDAWLNRGDLFHWSKKRRVLVEMSYMAVSPSLEEQIFALQIKNYQPVLAHPERYLYYHGNPEKLKQLKAAGCEFQLNLLSLNGYYGPGSRKAALKLLKEKMYSWAGTDVHNLKQLEELKLLLTQRQLMAILLRYEFMNQNVYI